MSDIPADISLIYCVSAGLETKSNTESRLIEILIEYRSYRRYITDISVVHRNIVDKSRLKHKCA